MQEEDCPIPKERSAFQRRICKLSLDPLDIEAVCEPDPGGLRVTNAGPGGGISRGLEGQSLISPESAEFSLCSKGALCLHTAL